MNRVLLAVCILLLGQSLASACMGDTYLDTVGRYGNPVASSPQPKSAADPSTKTFSKEGLKIVCGYLDGHVEMISFTRMGRAFLPAEEEALLRTNSQKKAWTPDEAKPGYYNREDGAKAVLQANSLEIASAKWLEMLAKLQKAKTDKSEKTPVKSTVPASR